MAHTESPLLALVKSDKKLYEIINKDNWCKGRNYLDANLLSYIFCPTNPVCMCLGAFVSYKCGIGAYTTLTKELGSIPGWNDAPERTVEEVIELCRRHNI